jgi:hypothetical protein
MKNKSHIHGEVATRLEAALAKGTEADKDGWDTDTHPWRLFLVELADTLTLKEKTLGGREPHPNPYGLLEEILSHPKIPKTEDNGLRWGKDLFLCLLLWREGGTEFADELTDSGFDPKEIDPLRVRIMARNGRTDSLKWMHEHGGDITNGTIPDQEHRALVAVMEYHRNKVEEVLEWYPLSGLEKAAALLEDWPKCREFISTQDHAQEMARITRETFRKRMLEKKREVIQSLSSKHARKHHEDGPVI